MQKNSTKRNKTAKEIATKMELSERTIRRYMAEDRKDFEKRARDRREKAYKLRIDENKSWDEVASIMDTTVDSVKGLVKRYRSEMKQKK
ncbi:plasmid replication protein [Shigella flexneri]